MPIDRASKLIHLLQGYFTINNKVPRQWRLPLNKLHLAVVYYLLFILWWYVIVLRASTGASPWCRWRVSRRCRSWWPTRPQRNCCSTSPTTRTSTSMTEMRYVNGRDVRLLLPLSGASMVGDQKGFMVTTKAWR